VLLWPPNFIFSRNSQIHFPPLLHLECTTFGDLPHDTTNAGRIKILIVITIALQDITLRMKWYWCCFDVRRDRCFMSLYDGGFGSGKLMSKINR